MSTNKIKKWDMLLLVICLLFFILFIAGSILLTNQKNTRINRSQAEVHQMKLKLVEIRDYFDKIAHGNNYAVKDFKAKLEELKNGFNLPADWNQLIENSESVGITTIDRLQNSMLFFRPEENKSHFNDTANRALAFNNANLKANTAVFNYIEANKSLGFIVNLLYSGDTTSVDIAFNHLENLLRYESQIANQLSQYAELQGIHNLTTDIMGLVRSKKDIIRLVDLANKFDSQAPQLLAKLDESLREGTYTTNLSKEGLPDSFIAVGYTIASLILLLMGLIIYRTLAERSQNRKISEEQNRDNQNAILEMLNVMKLLSEGDLTAKAKVNDPLTVPLANSFNLSVDELRTLVLAVNQSADKVTEAVKDTTNLVDRSTDASLSQATQITEATATVSHVTQAMLDVSAQTSAAVDIATSSTDVARSGSERVRSTIDGMDQIREHIQETSKRIKRLGESSQEIGDIVELINDIADQTHILALNAAIQASAAGEAGKGFAVVADELQRLAGRTGNATQRVEGLVKTIQTDTHEAIFAMEKSTSEVVNGANLAERAGESLNEIESVSRHLATLIQNVSQSSREVSELGTKVKASMESIRKLSEQNVDNTKSTKASVEGLLSLANKLKSSVAGFKIH